MIKSLDHILPGHHLPADVTVNGIEKDSRNVKAGNLFIAVPGVGGDGRNYMKEAIGRNAAAILYESVWEAVPPSSVNVPVFGIENLSDKLGSIASRFFDEPSALLKIIAVTGTNGKTSCSHFIANALTDLGMKCGIVGTLGSGFPESLQTPGLTTPGAIELQHMFSNFFNEDAVAVAIEASSHGLAQGRLDGTGIDIAVLTNVTRDHLDYHSDFEAYKNEKKKLFIRRELSGLVVNLDDILGQELSAELSSSPGLITYSIKNAAADIVAEGASFDEKGLGFRMRTPLGDAMVQSSLVGEFNLSNLLALAGVLFRCGFDIEDMGTALSSVKGVKGRMDLIQNEGFPTLVIDYAHTPDALSKALAACRRHCKGDLWCVFGCGGDRDKGKRPEMGRIASELADYLVLTDDNPRTEASNNIVKDILKGIESETEHRQKKVTIETNRNKAIEFAVGEAREEDWVLVAGKGHETYQEVGGDRVPYSDYEVVNHLTGVNAA